MKIHTGYRDSSEDQSTHKMSVFYQATNSTKSCEVANNQLTCLKIVYHHMKVDEKNYNLY